MSILTCERRDYVQKGHEGKKVGKVLFLNLSNKAFIQDDMKSLLTPFLSPVNKA